MTADPETPEPTMLSPDEAFKQLGNEMRIRILQTLGGADGPLSFTELRDRVGMPQGRQFNYHLDKLVGHFVAKTDDGYALRRPGERVVEAVLSGAVTEAPVIERAQIDRSCQLCDAPIEVRFRQERVETFCTECAGMWGRDEAAQRGYLGSKHLPPAGVKGRTPATLFNVAWTWTNLELFALASDICPQCSATIDVGMSICEDHEDTDGLCTHCENRYAVQLHFRCPNCIHEMDGTAPVYLAANTDLLAFLTAQGLNPVSPDSPAEVQRVYSTYDEEVLSVDPFEARYTFTVDRETLTLTVDEDLSVVDVVRGRAPEPV